MKRTYVLLTTLVLSLMLAGFSYAYWTDTLTVSGMADTGELSVIFCCDYVNPNEANIPLNQSLDIYNYSNSYVTEDGKYLVVTFDNLYPGAKAKVTACIKNEGTIPAKLTNMKLVDVIVDNYNATIDDAPGGIMQNLILQSEVGYFDVDGFMPGTPGVLTIGNNNQYFYPPGLLDQVILPIDGQYNFEFNIYLHENALNSTQERTVTFKIELEYEQFNTTT